MFVYLCRKKNKWTIEDWFNISSFEQRRVEKSVRLFSAIWLQCLSSFFSRFCMIVSTAYSGGSGGCGSKSIPIIITNETNEPSPMYGKLLLVLAWDELLKLLWLWLTDWHRPNAHFEWRARSFTLEPKMLNTNGCVQVCESYALELFSFSSSLFKSNFNYWTFIQ